MEHSFKIKYVTLCPRLKLMCFSKVTFAFFHHSQGTRTSTRWQETAINKSSE